MAVTTTGHRVAIEVSSDCLQAWICLLNPDDPSPFTLKEIVCVLKEGKIDISESVTQRIPEILAQANKVEERSERFLIAEGRPAVECVGEAFQRQESFLKKEKDWQGDASVSYYNYNSIHFVHAGELIGFLVASIPGVDGIDVFGKTLTPLRKPTNIVLDKSILRSKKNAAALLANEPGQVEFSGNLISISEVLTVSNDVDFKTGCIDSPVDIQIHGTVHDGFEVKSKRSITIGGAIEMATVESHGDVLVRGGILQKGRNVVKSGRDIVARFCDAADLLADGDVKICSELMNSHVHCDGKLLVEHGIVIGGRIYARDGVMAGTLGSDANVKTEIAVGIHPDVIEKAERIRENLKVQKEDAERIRRSVQPMIADLKRLSADQKEQVTELTYQADTIETEADEAERECMTMLQEARARGIPYVLVSKLIHEGVSIRIGRRSTSFQQKMHGPVRIEKRKVKNVTEFVAVNQLSGAISVLSSNYAPVTKLGESAEPIKTGDRKSDGSSS